MCVCGGGREGGRGKCILDGGLGPSPQENVSVPLSKHIHLSMITGRQELSLCQNFTLQLGRNFGGKHECLGEKLPPPSRLNPGAYDAVEAHSCF